MVPGNFCFIPNEHAYLFNSALHDLTEELEAFVERNKRINKNIIHNISIFYISKFELYTTINKDSST